MKKLFGFAVLFSCSLSSVFAEQYKSVDIYIDKDDLNEQNFKRIKKLKFGDADYEIEISVAHELLLSVYLICNQGKFWRNFPYVDSMCVSIYDNTEQKFAYSMVYKYAIIRKVFGSSQSIGSSSYVTLSNISKNQFIEKNKIRLVIKIAYNEWI